MKPQTNHEDDRVTRARTWAAQSATTPRAMKVIEDLLAYADERMRVNVGLVMENAELRRQIQDISEGREEIA